MITKAGKEDRSTSSGPKTDEFDLCDLWEVVETTRNFGRGGRARAHVVHQHVGRVREVQTNESTIFIRY